MLTGDLARRRARPTGRRRSSSPGGWPITPGSRSSTPSGGGRRRRPTAERARDAAAARRDRGARGARRHPSSWARPPSRRRQTTLGAAAGVLLRARAATSSSLVASSGFAPEELEAGSGSIARHGRPARRGGRGGTSSCRPRTRDELARRLPRARGRDRYGAWLSIPLSVAGADDRGDRALLPEARTFRPADLEYVGVARAADGAGARRAPCCSRRSSARASRAEQLAVRPQPPARVRDGARRRDLDLGGRHARLRAGEVECSARAPARSTCRREGPFQLLHGTGSLPPASADADGPRGQLPRRRAHPKAASGCSDESDWRGDEPYAADLRSPTSLGSRRRPARRRGTSRPGTLVAWFSTGEFPRGERQTAPRDDGAAGDPAARARRAARERAARRDSTRRPPRSGHGRSTRWPSG